MIVEYGIMSNKWSIEAENKFVAYAAICMVHYDHPSLVAVYNEELKDDSWLLNEHIVNRLDEIFGGPDSFGKFIMEHRDEILKAMDTIKKLV